MSSRNSGSPSGPADPGDDLLDDLLDAPPVRRRHPGGTKGVGTRGGKGRTSQVKCIASPAEVKAIRAALADATGCSSTSAALRRYLLGLAVAMGKLPKDYPID